MNNVGYWIQTGFSGEDGGCCQVKNHLALEEDPCLSFPERGDLSVAISIGRTYILSP